MTRLGARLRLLGAAVRTARGFAFAACCAATGVQAAIPPITSPDRWLAVADAGAAARGRLFELARLAVPVCSKPVVWTLGEAPYFVALQPPSHEPTRLVREAIQREFAAEPGEYVFIADPVGLPFGVAGARRGDRLRVADGRKWDAFAEFLQRARPASGADGSSTVSDKRRVQDFVDALSAELAVDSKIHFVVRRGGDELPITVIAVPVCPVGFAALDSKLSYADAWMNAVYVTLPLIASLSDDELTMVLAEELSLVLLDHQRSSVAPILMEVIGGAIGRLAQIGQNRELEGYPLPDDELIDGDRLTLWLLRSYGIQPSDYLRFLEKMKAQEDIVLKATYTRTRPLTARREAALRDEAARFEKTGTLRLPHTITLPRLQELVMRARSVLPSLQGRATPQRVVRSADADAYDFDRTPLRTRGQERFQHYLTLPGPKAFFVLEGSNWRFWSATSDPVAKGFDYCRREAKTCWLYAAENDVVWQVDEAQRVGALADWEALARLRAKSPGASGDNGAKEPPR
jgi:hypothetical protein